MKTDKSPLTVKHQSEEEQQRRQHLHGAHPQTLRFQIRPESHWASGWNQHFDSQLSAASSAFICTTRTRTRVTQTTDGVGWRAVGWVRVGAQGLEVRDPCCSLRRGRYGFVLFWKGPVVWAALFGISKTIQLFVWSCFCVRCHSWNKGSAAFWWRYRTRMFLFMCRSAHWFV